MALDDYPDNGLFFRTIPSDSLQMVAIAHVAERTGSTSIAIGYLDDSYGRGLAQSLRSAVGTRGLSVLAEIAFSGDDEQLADEADDLLANSPSVVAILGDAGDGTRLLAAVAQATAEDDPPIIVVNDALRDTQSQLVIQGLPSEVREQIKGVSPLAITPNDLTLTELYAANAYDCVNMVALAAIQAGTDSPPRSPPRWLRSAPAERNAGASSNAPSRSRAVCRSTTRGLRATPSFRHARAIRRRLTRDVERLTARWSDIEAKVEKSNDKGGGSPQLLYGEPDLTLKVVRDLFTEDFGKLVVSGDDAWEMVEDYVKQVAPDLEERLERYDENDAGRRRLRGVPHRRADRQGPRPQGVAALRRLLDLRPHGGHDGRRREHREVHRLRRQPRGDRHQEQPGSCRGDGPAATAARHRRDHRRRLHRHGAGEATATWCSAASSSAWVATEPATRSPR